MVLGMDQVEKNRGILFAKNHISTYRSAYGSFWRCGYIDKGNLYWIRNLRRIVESEEVSQVKKIISIP